LGRPTDRGRAPQARFPYLTEHRSASARRGADGVRTSRLQPAGNAGPRSTPAAVVAMPEDSGPAPRLVRAPGRPGSNIPTGSFADRPIERWR
jgi:hypothetical protein